MLAIEVTLELQDRNERAWFGDRLNELEGYRFAKSQGQIDQTPPADPAAPEAEEVIATITPEGVTKTPTTAPVLPTAAQIYDALREHLRKHEYAKSYAVLKKHGVEKVTDEMTPETKIALYADLTAGAK